MYYKKLQQTNYFTKTYLLLEKSFCLMAKKNNNTASTQLLKINSNISIIQMEYFSFIPYVDTRKKVTF